MKTFFNIVIHSDFEITEDNITQALNNGIHCAEDSHFKVRVTKDDRTIIERLQNECEMRANALGGLLKDK